MNANLSRIWQAFMEATTPTQGEPLTVRIPTDPATKRRREYDAHAKQLTEDQKRAERILAKKNITPRARRKAQDDLKRLERASWILNREYPEFAEGVPTE